MSKDICVEAEHRASEEFQSLAVPYKTNQSTVNLSKESIYSRLDKPKVVQPREEIKLKPELENHVNEPQVVPLVLGRARFNRSES